MKWLTLILTLPTANATARMRIWRALKASGAAVLRDGVYLLPERDDCHSALAEIAEDIEANGGTAYLLQADGAIAATFPSLFDRTEDYAALLTAISETHAALNIDNALDTLKQFRKLGKTFAAIGATDFFPGEAQRQVDVALRALEVAANAILSPDEPHAATGAVARLNLVDYQGRIWATRARPWVDRLASAWLIRRFIDPAARFLWLASQADCPADALGFDFDGAAFSHIGAKVTFETLLASFALDQPALQRLGALVHYLDVGGIPPAEAGGVERVLAGLRNTISNDDQLLAAAGHIFDGLLAAFQPEIQTT
ncbi:chromate resistance protein ChrB domain-containing protein [Andreprevotia chitinilytica]|uniref:chromate resistance protein ChrB domain-containing protein n=1 Tax=Andreprevotia chitinilytica TaxID=396808 RepID=UPI0005548E27|nr:chromate resistance protein ChrB domain-containing protein [Andreprevotia chitinilytica]